MRQFRLGRTKEQLPVSVPVQDSLKSRPFLPPSEVAETSIPDLQAQVEHAQRFGHSFSKLMSESSASALQLSPLTKPDVPLEQPPLAIQPQQHSPAFPMIQREPTGESEAEENAGLSSSQPAQGSSPGKEKKKRRPRTPEETEARRQRREERLRRRRERSAQDKGKEKEPQLVEQEQLQDLMAAEIDAESANEVEAEEAIGLPTAEPLSDLKGEVDEESALGKKGLRKGPRRPPARKARRGIPQARKPWGNGEQRRPQPIPLSVWKLKPQSRHDIDPADEEWLDFEDPELSQARTRFHKKGGRLKTAEELEASRQRQKVRRQVRRQRLQEIQEEERLAAVKAQAVKAFIKFRLKTADSKVARQFYEKYNTWLESLPPLEMAAVHFYSGYHYTLQLSGQQLLQELSNHPSREEIIAAAKEKEKSWVASLTPDEQVFFATYDPDKGFQMGIKPPPVQDNLRLSFEYSHGIGLGEKYRDWANSLPPPASEVARRWGFDLKYYSYKDEGEIQDLLEDASIDLSVDEFVAAIQEKQKLWVLSLTQDEQVIFAEDYPEIAQKWLTPSAQGATDTAKKKKSRTSGNQAKGKEKEKEKEKGKGKEKGKEKEKDLPQPINAELSEAELSYREKEKLFFGNLTRKERQAYDWDESHLEGQRHGQPPLPPEPKALAYYREKEKLWIASLTPDEKQVFKALHPGRAKLLRPLLWPGEETDDDAVPIRRMPRRGGGRGDRRKQGPNNR